MFFPEGGLDLREETSGWAVPKDWGAVLVGAGKP